jgi:hypothetical protein
MIRAIGNVATRHLLDRRLNPLPELREAALAGGAVPLPLRRGRSLPPGRPDARRRAACRPRRGPRDGGIVAEIPAGLLVFVGVANGTARPTSNTSPPGSATCASLRTTTAG